MNFVVIIAFSQNDSITNKYDSGKKYIEIVDTIISVKLNVNTEFELFEEKGDDFYYDIRPNISLTSKLSFSYRFISFGIGFKPKFIPGNNDNDMQGKTKILSFGINILTDHWLQDFQYADIKGFYLHNTGDFDSTWVKGTDPYLQLPDTRISVFRGSTGYKFNENLSLKSISSKTEIQLKSAGSLIPFITYDYYILDNKSNTTPQSSSQRSDNFDMVASFGYIYTFVLKTKFYISAGVFPGIGFQYTYLLTRYPDNLFKSSYTDPLYRIQEKAAIGYNSTKFYAGAEISATQSTRKQNNTNIAVKSTRSFFQIFVGYRFEAPGFLKQKTNQVKAMTPAKVQKMIE